MSDWSTETEELLLKFLDSDLSQSEREETQRMIDADPKLAAYVELQGQIEGSIRRLFCPPEADPGLLRSIRSADQLTPVETPPVGRTQDRRVLLTLLATAASITFAVLSIKSFLADPEATIAYRQRPLVEVYEDCVSEGFEPYWVCDDPALFAATFQRRQGVRLKLAELRDDQEMLGLAYLAGLSDDSTSLLATVGGKPVVVIIDTSGNDWSPEVGDFAEPGLRVSRWERFGLVFYQVSPFGTPLLSDAFGLADDEERFRDEPSSSNALSE